MDLSIILAHYLPDPDHNCKTAIKKTLDHLEQQVGDLDVEIIVCDDGSHKPDLQIKKLTELKLGDGRVCLDYQDHQARTFAEASLGTKAEHLTHWLYLPRTKMISSKARLWNLATTVAKSDNLVFFDDDNYLLKDKSLALFSTLLEQYKLVFGQIVDSNQRPRPYSSKRVQGSTFGLKKELLNSIGGFGTWTEKVSSGIDSDLWFKLYNELKNDHPYSAVFTQDIQTLDGCSKRWKPFVGSFFRHRVVRKEFSRINGCKNYRSVRHNPSRDKARWITNLA